MVDELYDRGYQAGRGELHAGIEALVGRIRDTFTPIFEVMRRIEFDAPWDTERGSKANA